MSDPFEDSPEPFMDGDDLPKPAIGTILHLKEDGPTWDTEINEFYPREMRVIRTFDTLAESWDPIGEAAWHQREVNELMGHRGHWYADCENLEDNGETYVVASYEVSHVD